MDPRLEGLLARLDTVPAEIADDDGGGTTSTLVGYLLRSPADIVRVVTGHLCLEIAIDDVLAAEELRAAEADTPPAALPVTLTLRRPARLLAVAPSDCYRTLIWPERRPFSVIVRARAPGALPFASPRFDALSASFHGRGNEGGGGDGAAALGEPGR